MEFLVLVLLDVAACEDLFEMLGEGDVDRRDVFEVAVDLYPNLLLFQNQAFADRSPPYMPASGFAKAIRVLIPTDNGASTCTVAARNRRQVTHQ